MRAGAPKCALTSFLRNRAQHGTFFTRMELTTLVLSLVGAVTGLINMVVILAVNGKLDRLTGRVDSLEHGHNAHVNSPALHAR